jgi:hypothetical protein
MQRDERGDAAMSAIIEIVDPATAEILRHKTEAERLAIAWGMWKSARSMLANLLRAEHHDWSAIEINREIARRFAHGTGNHADRDATAPLSL